MRRAAFVLGLAAVFSSAAAAAPDLGPEGYLPAIDFVRGLGDGTVELEPFGPFAPAPRAVPRAAAEPGTWTVLFYNDADFTPGYDPHFDFCAEMRSSAHVSVIELQDSYGGPGLLWRIDESHTPIGLTDGGFPVEPDMGDGTTLAGFVAYAKTHYPAERYLLAMYDHGGAWMGACVDQTSGSWLYTDEIRAALDAAGGVDILAFTAPCEMGSIEAAYELRGVVDVVVGSEELSGYAAWHGMMDEMCALLEASAGVPTASLAADIVALVGANDYWDNEWLTMSAVETAATPAAVASVDAVAKHLVDYMSLLRLPLQQAMFASWRMGWGGTYVDDLIDLYDFALQLEARTGDAVLVQHLEGLRAALDAAVLAEIHGTAQLGTHGLSVEFPRDVARYSPYYTAIDLDFVADTAWDEMLQVYHWLLTDAPGGPPVLGLEVLGGPNPGGEGLGLRLILPERGDLRVDVYDLLGRRLRRLAAGPRDGGEHVLAWDGRDAAGRRQPSGAYFFVVEAVGRRATARGTLVR